MENRYYEDQLRETSDHEKENKKAKGMDELQKEAKWH